ncbi:1,4-dihydroxy-2-naphthoate polyprenyltransferase [Herbiconiux sp. CPCC 203407]|uniref:1,4-dihydroxy-2-naphthoate octaprenyltransferase n=1 Tax=Herbiconiux oxytropis TaxID=2970915 RepID=A0AA41XF46_9MICO|nr:1,4-dihydroxy-2-naphthoate polyprenyltransferase [Herbiconiux oxytropis]MCS5722792.1 1,4-dihydroxy-2-naphthoate polyprenyltransferase [Herbiconiux oxytropis]MCS5727062.1 1,4-dihydroxy-2-naphthoate polyprenyltransferase [Herbiconiux oxytropis]
MSTSKKKRPRGNPARSGNPARAHRVADGGGGTTVDGRPATPPAGPRTPAAAWIAGARLRTLTLSIAPVALGTGAAAVMTDIDLPLVLLCLAVSVLLQIGVNYANDYSDGIRGTDDHRVGPPRLTGSGLVPARRVLTAALVFFGLAAVAGLAITVITGHWWLLAVGAVAIAAGWFYTGGKHPYGYYALGEVFVFIFFGLVATGGTTFILAGDISTESWLSGVAIGLIACAVLMANNIRDIDQDKLAKKRTLSVLIGRTASRVVYVVYLVLAYAILWFFGLLYPLAPLVFFTLLITVPASIIMITARKPREFVTVLQLTSLFGLLYGIGLGLAFAF